MNDKELYEMKLHDEETIYQGFYVVRVPGGWLYKIDNEQVGGTWVTDAVFVPYNNEFDV